ncbi:Flp pilus assembly protein CpaB [Thiohalocapsa marina]|uniref:Flp pilus assembly protein CpaB n=1 Tax=Thiohalocapsa marina TaxID=424902 RepID=A0A5M8FJ44_9GAMM|nr:Flp pilus assembly protein CpaB [Thiohalocapsa marina]KAA6184697.1 Flp pilus assembly protein CpaB [Thiohalocapsa marina]
MRAGSLITILISLLLAGVVAYLGNEWMNRQLAVRQPAAPAERVKVVAAAVDIPVDSVIEDKHLKLIEIPPDLLPQGAITDKAELRGEIVKDSIYAGEIISGKRLLSGPGGSVLAAKVEPGMRALTIGVDEVSGLSGFLLPGSRVDVISMRGGNARTILRDMKILAVGERLQVDESRNVKVRAVTLEVNPRQAEILAEITTGGGIRLTLRNQLDRDLGEGSVSATEAPEAEAELARAAQANILRARSPQPITVIRGTSWDQSQGLSTLPSRSVAPLNEDAEEGAE